MPQSKENSNLREEKNTIAVLIPEVFSAVFQPLDNYQHLGLLSLVNTPIINYMLKWLQQNDVNETIIYCPNNPECHFTYGIASLREHCVSWCKRSTSHMKVSVISSENCTSVGDVLRDLDSKSVIKSDFFLLSGPVIGNVDLKSFMRNFKNVNKSDPTCVMSTVYLKSLGKNRDTVDLSRFVNVIIDAKTGKLLSHSHARHKPRISVPSEFLQSSSVLKIYPSLEDPAISICSPAIPPLFSDNFDYDTRNSLIQGIIEQEELLGYSVNVQIAERGYAICINSLRAYDLISKSIIKRELYPLVPEVSLSSSRIRYLFESFSCIYWDSGATFHKKSLGQNVVVDAGTTIDPRSKVSHSVIGKHCNVKENVTINGSYIGNNVTINKGCILDCCFVSDNVKLLAGVHLEEGVILGPQTILGPNLKVDKFVKLVSEPQRDQQELDQMVCGNEGRAFRFESSTDIQSWASVGYDHHDDDEINSDGSESVDALSGPNTGNDQELSSDEERENEFVREVEDSLINAYTNKSAIENVILEINSSRHAYNVTMETVLSTVVKGILSTVNSMKQSPDDNLRISVQAGLTFFNELIKNYVKGPKDQMIVLKAIEELVENDSRYLSVVDAILYKLNQVSELINDEVILFWFYKSTKHTSVFDKLSEKIQVFVKWLEEESESD